MTTSALSHIVLELYLATYCGRQDAYVLDSQEHVNQPLTPDLAEWAFIEGHSLSGYTAEVMPDQTWTHVGAVDVDEDRPIEDGFKLRDAFATHGIPSLLVSSRRGFHLWFSFEGDGTHDSERFGRVPAGTVRRALTTVLGLEGYSGPSIEVFPKQSAAPWGVGALRLPLMRHPKTGEVYPAYDPDRTPIDRVTELVNYTATDLTSPWEAVWKVAGSNALPVEYPRDLGSYRRPTYQSGPVPTIVALLDRMGVQAVAGRSIRCPFHSDQHASLSIASDDLRAFCKSPVCDLYQNGRGMGSLGLASYLAKARPSTT